MPPKRRAPVVKKTISSPVQKKKKEEVDETPTDSESATTKRAAKINQLGYFPLLALPDLPIVKVLSNLNEYQRRSLRYCEKIDRLDVELGRDREGPSTADRSRDIYANIITTENGSALRCTRYDPNVLDGPRTLRMDMKGIVARMKPYMGKVQYGTLDIKFDKSDDFQGELIEGFKHAQCRRIEVKCKYDDNNSYLSLSQSITDDVFKDFVQKKERVDLSFICGELTAEGILAAYKAAGRHNITSFFVKDMEVVKDILKASSVDDRDGKLKLRNKRVFTSFSDPIRGDEYRLRGNEGAIFIYYKRYKFGDKGISMSFWKN